MSQIRDPAYITEQGRTMMTAGGDVTYTKAVLYGQDISHLTADQVQALTSIGSPLKQVPIGVSDKQSNGKDTTVVLEATFQNDGLTADLPYTAVGFFAKKGEDEKLIIVAVANAGAYLAATRPDGVATDALDLKVAIAIGDATNVTAVVDPAASVTPATLNGAINETKQVLTALIDTKASQSNLDQTNAEVAKKADSEAVNSQLATKANTTDIDKQVKTLNDAINTKADKATVDAEIAKIDFTPYAKTADVTAQINAVSDEIATKVGADYSYSKAQLDEKLLALSTDTNGKVSADQVTALIADKANKADVDKSFKAANDTLATKADQATTYSKTDVDKLLSAKDDTTDVDAKIKTVTDLANTKANASDVYTQSQLNAFFSQRDTRITGNANLINQINSTRLPLYQGSDGEDLKGFFTPQIRMYRGNGSVKNIPKDSQYQSQCFGTLIVLPDGAGNGNDGSQIWISPERKAWIAQSNGQGAKSWSDWSRFTLTSDLSALQSALQAKIDAKADASNVYSKSEVDSKTTATIVTGYDIPSKTRQTMSAGVNVKWLVDSSVIDIVADQINQLKGRRTIDNPDFNSLTDGGSYYITNPQGGKNGPTGSWGNLFVSNGNGHRISQLYFPDDGSALYMRELDETTWHGWIQLATTAQVNDAKNTANWDNINGRPQDQINKINTDNPLFRMITNSNNWNDIFGVNNGSNVLTSLRINAGGSGALLNNYAAGIGFGGADTKGVLSVAYGDHQARITGGNGNGPAWSEDIAWKSDINSLLNAINQQNQTIQSLTTRLTNAENEIRYIKDNYIEGRRFPASQEAQANSWENENPQRIAFITK